VKDCISGFLNFHKPFGWTSHDCVAKVRRLLRIKRVGHAGTLDPAATGVLPIAVGRATRLLQYLPSDKAYHATIRFGIRTTTDDLQGDVLSQQSASHLDFAAIQHALLDFQGTIQQVPPQYSAIQVEGQRLYALARAGQVVDVPVRTVTVHHIQVLDWRSPQDYPELDVAIACGAGTYIRAIARDLGERMQVGATLARLTRTMSSGFEIEQSFSLADLEKQVEASCLSLISAEDVLHHLPRLTLAQPEAHRWVLGQRLAVDDRSTLMESPVYRVYNEAEQLLGITAICWEETEQGAVLAPKLVLIEPDKV
jgi:tRNA pseudouridine55 synthase